MKLNTLVGVLLAVLTWALLLAFAVAFGEDRKPAAPGGEKTTAVAIAPISLTEAEAKDVEINQLQRDKLILQMQAVEKEIDQKFHFRDQQAQLYKELDALTAACAKAHGVDATKYRLDADKKQLVPIPSK